MSVGHVAREFERAGMATVIIAAKSFESRMRMMALPRVLLTPELLGRPIGPPFDRQRQYAVVSQALALLETATQNSTLEYAVP